METTTETRTATVYDIETGHEITGGLFADVTNPGEALAAARDIATERGRPVTLEDPDEGERTVYPEGGVSRVSAGDASPGEAPDSGPYAIIDGTATVRALAWHVNEQAAQTWHRDEGPGRLVYLDLAEGEQVEIGDTVRVDEDGVAQVAD